MLLSCLSLQAEVVMNSKGKYGFMNDDGTLVINYVYDFIGSFSESGVAIVKKGKKFGLINRNGEMVLPVAYSQIVKFDNDKTLIIKNKKMGLITNDGKILHNPKYIHIFPFNSQGIAIAVVNQNGGKDLLSQSNMVALLKSDGKEIVRGTAGSLAEFAEEDKIRYVSSIKGDTINTTCGYFYNNATNSYHNVDGDVVFNDAVRTQIYQQVFNNPSATYANRHSGIKVQESNPFENVIYFVYNLYVDANTVKVSTGYYDFLNRKLLYHLNYDGYRKYNASTQKYTFNTGNISVSTYKFQDGIGLIKVSGKDTRAGDYVIDSSGNLVKKLKSGYAYPPSNGLMVMGDEYGDFGLWSTQYNYYTIYPKYRTVKTAVTPYGRWAVKGYSFKWGVVNVWTGDTIVPFEYDNIKQRTNSDCFDVQKDGKWGIYMNDKLVLDCICDSIYGINSTSVLFSNWEKHYKNHDKNRIGLFCLYADTINYYEGYEGVYDADPVHHGGYLWLLYKHDENNRLVYGCVNNYGWEVVPFVFEDKEMALMALSHFKDKQAKYFTKADYRRLKLRFSRKTRTYSLYDLDRIQMSDWDY